MISLLGCCHRELRFYNDLLITATLYYIGTDSLVLTVMLLHFRLGGGIPLAIIFQITFVWYNHLLLFIQLIILSINIMSDNIFF